MNRLPMNHRSPWSLLSLALLLLACSEASPISDNPTDDDPEGGVTWYGDVAHVAQEKCMGCHNDAAPTFSMTTFDESLIARAGLMAAYVEDGTMPPWKPSADCNHFVGERLLSTDEKDLFRKWADGGARKGDPADGPEPRAEAAGLARVDRHLEMPESFTPAPPEGEVDDHRCFVLDPGLTVAEQLVGFNIVPGERGVVHHVLLYLADAGDAEALDDADPGIGYACSGGPIASSAQVIAGWVPGMPANTYPQGTGIPLAPGKTVIMQIHYNTLQTGPLPDQTAVELMFADEPMDATAQIQALRNADFAIPPQASNFTATSALDVPTNATIWALAPHMHLKGRRAVVEVAHENGERTCLVDIPDWDFNWQQFYFFEEGIHLSPGDRVELSCTWDNNSDDEVRWGDGTDDEMCISYAYVTGGHAN